MLTDRGGRHISWRTAFVDMEGPPPVAQGSIPLQEAQRMVPAPWWDAPERLAQATSQTEQCSLEGRLERPRGVGLLHERGQAPSWPRSLGRPRGHTTARQETCWGGDTRS